MTINKITNKTNKRGNPYHHGQLRQALLAAGDEVLREVGFKGFTLRECARRAGVSHAAPKHHFGDTTGFLTEIAAGGFRKLTAMLKREIGKASNLEEEFIATTRAYSKFADANPEHFRIMFRCDLVNLDAEVLHEAAQATFTELTNVIRRQRGEAEITVDTLEDTVRLEDVLNDIVIGWAHIHGFAHLRMEGNLQMANKALANRLLKRSSERLSRMMQDEANRSD